MLNKKTAVFLAVLFTSVAVVQAQSIADFEKKMQDKNNQINKIEQEKKNIQVQIENHKKDISAKLAAAVKNYNCTLAQVTPLKEAKLPVDAPINARNPEVLEFLVKNSFDPKQGDTAIKHALAVDSFTLLNAVLNMQDAQFLSLPRQWVAKDNNDFLYNYKTNLTDHAQKAFLVIFAYEDSYFQEVAENKALFLAMIEHEAGKANSIFKINAGPLSIKEFSLFKHVNNFSSNFMLGKADDVFKTALSALEKKTPGTIDKIVSIIVVEGATRGKYAIESSSIETYISIGKELNVEFTVTKATLDSNKTKDLDSKTRKKLLKLIGEKTEIHKFDLKAL